MYQTIVKRVLDLAFSCIALLLLLPVLLLIGFLVRIFLGSPVVFSQTRVGKEEKLFTIYKFRSMLETKDEVGKLLHPEDRVTAFGAFLRKFSIDELPELINIIRGDMSLIGPRPLLKEYLPLYSEEQRKRHDIRPGLTGWAQVNGRNKISWQEKFALDVWYIDHLSFRLDCRIVLLTLKKVLGGKEISQEGKATVDRFNGKN